MSGFIEQCGNILLGCVLVIGSLVVLLPAAQVVASEFRDLFRK